MVRLDQRSARLMVAVIKIGGGDEHAGVHKQHARGASAVGGVSAEAALFK